MSDRWQEIINAARRIDKKYQALDEERLGRKWSNTEFLAATATDWGELVEKIMIFDKLRDGEAKKQEIAHELSDLLWALIVLSDRLEIKLDEAFLNTINELEVRLKDLPGE